MSNNIVNAAPSTPENNAAAEPNPAGTIAPRSAEAYQELLSEIEAVAELAPINVDIPGAVTTVLGSLPEITAVRPFIVQDLPTFDINKIDKLEDYTLAVSHAHTLYRAAWAPKVEVSTLASELTTLRDQLLVDATSLASYGFINGERLKECKSDPGYRPVAYDVLTIIAVLRESWRTIAGRTPVTLAVIDHAAVLAEQFLQAIGLREQAPATVGEAAVTRQKAFTLFFNVYEDVRRAIQYVRGKAGDADEIAPSLFAGRSGGRRKSANDPAATTTPSTGTPAASPNPVAVASPALPITQPFAS
jgi:hypothetical protein